MKRIYARIVTAAVAALSFLPSARAATPVGPARADLCRKIAALRVDWSAGKLKQQVSAGDVRTLQDWLDLFEDEGCIHPSAITGTPLEMFDAMTAIQQQLAANSPELPATVDTLMPRLERLTKIWYADGSVGDIAGPWTPLTEASVVGADHGELILSAKCAGSPDVRITVRAYEAGSVFRLFGPNQGFFTPESLEPAVADVRQSSGDAALRAGRNTLKVTLRPLRMTLTDDGGRTLWDGGDVALLLDPVTHAVKAVQQASRLTDQDHCFGLGERFNRLDQRGHVVTNWTSDSLFSSVRSKWTETYKPVPLVLDPRGVSVFYNTQALSRMDLGATDPARLSVTTAEPVFDDYLFVGEPMTALRGYCKLTGRPVAVPDWVLTPWMGGGVGRWNLNGADQSCETVKQAVVRMQGLDIPHTAIYIEGLPTDKPQGKALLAWLQERHLKPIAWYGPNAAKTETEDFTPEQLKRLFIHTADGGTFVCPPGRFLGGSYYIDFTNPLSVEMLIRRWKWHIDEGIRGCMIDGGEESPRDGVYDNGLRGDVMHNLYPLFYHRAHQTLFDELTPGDYVLFGRSGCAGDQASMGQFPGDMPGDFSGLTGAIHAGLSASASGFSLWGSDIGGYWSRDGKPPAKDVYLRWLQFAVFSPMTRAHGEKSPREPWAWDDEATAVYKHYVWMKTSLLPYLSGVARHAHETGEPILRPLPLAYPDDALALAVDDEYLFGPDWLVAPVHAPGTTRALYLPAGTWYDANDHFKAVPGARSFEQATPLTRVPLFGRGGAVIPLTLNARWELGESFSAGSESVVLVLPDADGVPSSGHGLAVSRQGQDLVVSGTGDATQNLWIPAATKPTVRVGPHAIEVGDDLPAPGPMPVAGYDSAAGRLCVRARLLPDEPLVVKGYFAGSPSL